STRTSSTAPSRARRRRRCACRSTVDAGRSSRRTRATGSSSIRRATGSTSFSASPTVSVCPSSISRPTTLKARRRRSPTFSIASGSAPRSRSARRSSASRRAARRAGRSWKRRCSSSSVPRLDSLRKDARTYEAAGVSLATANAVVDRLRAAVESTGATGFGSFAGLYPLDEQRFLAASTDSVGSKLMLHRQAGTLRWGGMDLAAHCINDVLCSGADPLFLLDYVAAAHLELEQVAELVEGAAEVCRAAGCALIGGETAELP